METRNRGRQLAALIHEAREAKNLSIRKLAEAIGTTPSYIHKLEAGWFHSISPENINALAQTLDLEDLFAVAGYRVPEGWPSFSGYLRTKYGEDLSEEAINRMTAYFEFERSQHPEEDEKSDEDRSTGGRP